MNHILLVAIATLLLAASPFRAAAQPGNAANGERMYRACAPCHSLEPDRNMTGPSLAELWNRKSGGLPSFPRYSNPLKSSGILWNDDTLDAWIKDPQHFIPGNTMTFPGMRDAGQRADLLAFLKDATRPGRAPKAAQGSNQMGGMMMGGVPNLKQLDPEDRVLLINHCGDTYKIATEDGKTRDFWERNLRFKTDVGADGPQPGVPAIVPAGMMGDRGRVLDVGIGSGLNLPFYGQRAREVFGLDPSSRLLARAQDQTQHMQVHVHLLEGSAECIPLTDQSMDTVVMTWTGVAFPMFMPLSEKCDACSAPAGVCCSWNMGALRSLAWRAGRSVLIRSGCDCPGAAT